MLCGPRRHSTYYGYTNTYYGSTYSLGAASASRTSTPPSHASGATCSSNPNPNPNPNSNQAPQPVAQPKRSQRVPQREEDAYFVDKRMTSGGIADAEMDDATQVQPPPPSPPPPPPPG